MTCDTIQDTLCTMRQVCVDTITVSRYIADSVTLEALKSSQELFSTYFMMFVAVVGVILTGFTLFTAFSFWKNSKLEKEQKEELAKIKGFENKIETLKTELKKEIEKDRKNNQDIFNDILMKMMGNYYMDAKVRFEAEDWTSHFICLCNYYFTLGEIYLPDGEIIKNLARTKVFLDMYKDKEVPVPLGTFFHSLLRFIENSEKVNEKIFLEAKSLYHNLIDVFTYEKIIAKLRYYFEDNEHDQTIGKVLALAERYKPPV